MALERITEAYLDLAPCEYPRLEVSYPPPEVKYSTSQTSRDIASLRKLLAKNDMEDVYRNSLKTNTISHYVRLVDHCYHHHGQFSPDQDNDMVEILQVLAFDLYHDRASVGNCYYEDFEKDNIRQIIYRFSEKTLHQYLMLVYIDRHWDTICYNCAFC